MIFFFSGRYLKKFVLLFKKRKLETFPKSTLRKKGNKNKQNKVGFNIITSSINLIPLRKQTCWKKPLDYFAVEFCTFFLKISLRHKHLHFIFTMDYIYMIMLMFIPMCNTLTCTCNCGPSNYTPSASCTTSTQCSQVCYWGYPTCYQVNTQGCCGSSSCVWYSGEQVYAKSGTCVCKCGSTSQGVTEQGRANSSVCATSTCQSACQILYPSTCGSGINNAYCGDAPAQYHIGIFSLFFFVIIAFYVTQ